MNKIENLAKIAECAVKSKTEKFFAPNHGSSCGEEVEITTFYNPLTSRWTDKETAMVGFVMNEIKPHIIKGVKSLLTPPIQNT